APHSREQASEYSPKTTTSADVFSGLMTPVPGLESWLNERSLSKYLQSIMFWCHEKGVSNLQEILPHLDELSDDLSMKTFEKQRLFQGPPRLGLMGRVDEAAEDGAWSDYGQDTPEYSDGQDYYAYSDSGGQDSPWGYEVSPEDYYDEGWDSG
ncbi:unnamed protein product, partial [Symbiodinium necroappetens]